MQKDVRISWCKVFSLSCWKVAQSNLHGARIWSAIHRWMTITPQHLKRFFYQKSSKKISADCNEYLTGSMLQDKKHAGHFPARNLSMCLSLSLRAVTLKSHASCLKLNINSSILLDWGQCNLKSGSSKSRVAWGTVTQVHLIWAQPTVAGRDESAVAFPVNSRPVSLSFNPWWKSEQTHGYGQPIVATDCLCHTQWVGSEPKCICILYKWPCKM